MGQLIDVSHHQGNVDWRAARTDADGYYVKLTEGSSYVDPAWRVYASSVDLIGVPRGAYHFADGGNPEVEADHFADQYLSVRGWLLRPVLDAEITAISAAWIARFRARFRTRVGRPFFRVYSSRSLLVGQLDPGPWCDRFTDIWAARYNAVLGWSHPSLVLWQNTSAAREPGFVGSVDLDQYMNGWTPARDAAELAATTGGTDMATIIPLHVDDAAGHAWSDPFSQGSNSLYFAEGYLGMRTYYGGLAGAVPAGLKGVRVNFLRDDGTSEGGVGSLDLVWNHREVLKLPDGCSGVTLDWTPATDGTRCAAAIELKAK